MIFFSDVLKCHLSLCIKDFDIAFGVLINLNDPYSTLDKWMRTIKSPEMREKFNKFFLGNLEKFVKNSKKTNFLRRIHLKLS